MPEPERRSTAATVVLVVAWLVWAYGVLSVPVYFLVALLTPTSGELDLQLTSMLALTSAVVGAIALGLGRALPRSLVRRKKLDPMGVGGQLGLLGVAFVGWCLAESIALSGLTLFFLSGGLLLLSAFLLASVLLMAFMTPREWTAARS